MGAGHRWRVTGRTARFESELLTFFWNTWRPWEGWSDVAWRGMAVPLRMFQLRFSAGFPADGATLTVREESPCEQYARDDDLIVTYAESPDRLVWPQLDWRGISPFPGTCGVELIVSLQTNLLASDPRVAIRFAWGDAEACQLESSSAWQRIEAAHGTAVLLTEEMPGAVLIRPAGCQVSCAVLVHPTDFRGGEVRIGRSESVMECALMTEFLEKGVIRKGRVQGLFMPREGDEQRAAEAYRHLSLAAPPLTV